MQVRGILTGKGEGRNTTSDFHTPSLPTYTLGQHRNLLCSAKTRSSSQLCHQKEDMTQALRDSSLGKTWGRSCLHVALAMAYGKMMDASYLQPSILPACLLCHLQVSLGEQIVVKRPNSFGSASTWHSALCELQESGISPNQPVHLLWPNLYGEVIRIERGFQWTWHGEDARLVASTHTSKDHALGSTSTFLSFPVPGVGNAAQN